ncbi:MAG: MBL fold metallo-hydrolase [Deltaproteobacteria bacterium]|nr:MBL fold metallo-hydrolase [Deltaproteobacteria bacterium]
MVIMAKDDTIQIDKLELGPFGTNAYILTCRQTGESVLVDAPGETEKILGHLQGSVPKYILMTHNHMDHVGALAEVKSRLKVPLAAHSADSAGLPVSTDIALNEGDTISFGKIKLRVMHTPGHTPGSLCFLTGKYLISGDTIFPGGPGKTGSPGAFKQIVESITSKVFELPDETEVYPGHGESTTLKKEKQEFEDFSSRPHDPNLCGDVLWLSS